MKTDRKYLSRAKEIRDVKAEGGKKAGSSAIGQAEVVATSKKRKWNVVSRGPYEAQALEVVLAPPSTPVVVIQVFNLEEDVVSSSSTPTSGVQTMVC